MSASLREQIEHAICADLAALAYLRTRAPYEGEFNGEQPEEIRRQVLAQAPAVLVGTGPGAYAGESMSRRRYTKEIEVRVFIVAKTFRSRTAQKHGERHGGAGDQPGVYRMLEQVGDRLAGWDCGLEGVGPLQLRSEQPVMQEPDLCVWVLVLNAEVDVQAPDRAAAVANNLSEIAGALHDPDAPQVGGADVELVNLSVEVTP